MTRDEAIQSAVDALDQDTLRFAGPLVREALRLAGFAIVPLEPTEKMLEAARDWSIAKYSKAIGNDAATGCYSAMIAADEKEQIDG